MKDRIEKMKRSEAVVSFLPIHSGDGYGYGGGAVLTIGTHAITLGEGHESNKLAEELASRWNAGLADPIKF